jgi:AAA domain
MPVEFLKREGLQDLPDGRGVAILYCDVDGKQLYVKRRTALKATEGSFLPPRTKLQPYLLNRLDSARKDRTLFLTEGETDALTLLFHGYPSLGIPGAASAKCLNVEHLSCIDAVNLIRDSDEAGERFVKAIIFRLNALGYGGLVIVVSMPDGLKDPSDLHCSDPEKFKDRFEEQRARGTVVKMTGPASKDRKPPIAPPSNRPGFHPKLFQSPEFFAADFRKEWLVKGVLVRGQPAVLGGPKKSLKTNLLVDLALSLATGTKFLGRFDVARIVRVMVLSGESGEATLQETARRIAKAKGVDCTSAEIVWGTELPQLSNPDHLNDLGNILVEQRIDVLIIDPLYLCLLSGDKAGAEAANYYQMGPLFHQIAQACLSVNTTPILTPHAKKERSDERPLELDDLAFSGIGEYCRQWILVNRRERYQGDGLHKLHLSIGGSAGQSFFGQLDIDEGTLGDDFSGRKWEVTVNNVVEVKEAKQIAREQKKTEQDQKDELAVAGVIDRMLHAGEQATTTRIRNGSGIGRPRTDRALERLRVSGLFKPSRDSAVGGYGAQQKAEVWRRSEKANGVS